MPVTIDLEYLIEFLNELRAVGFDVSTQQYIAAQDLLIALAANGHLPEDARSLRTLLAPVVCSSSHEQESFSRYFDRWIKRDPHAAKPAQIDGEPEPASTDPVKQSWTNIFRKPASVVGSVVLIVGLTAGIVLLISAQTLTLTGSVIDADNNNPLRGATISYSQKTVSTDGEGNFSITYRNKELPIPVNIQSDGYESGKEIVNASTAAPLVVRLAPLPTPDPFPLTPITPITPITTRTSQPSPYPSPLVINLLPLPTPTASTGKLDTWIGYGTVMLPLVLFGGWWIWRTRLNRALLHKLQRVTEPRLDQLIVKDGASRLFQDPSFRRTIQELRRHRQRGANELDAQRTVSRTVQQGGLFTPAYGSRQTLPEYLVLIDRASFADHQARLYDEIVRRLVQDNVFVDTYYFQGDPRLCRKHDKNSPYFSLQEIAALHPDHHLIIFSDGATFINPLTGDTERWVEMFSTWTTRALLTPELPAQWGHRERAMAELDFIVLPATKEGLGVFTELLGGGARVSVELDWRARPYPWLLRDRTRRWLENHEPQAANLQRLCDQLKVFLGSKGYHWLSACAVYPVLYWELTLYLGFKLFRDRTQIEDRLLSLVRLPWLRYGSVPDWLRLKLISDLSPKDEASVRKALEELLLTVMQQPADGIRLDIASEEKEPVGLIERLKNRVKRWNFRRWFWQFAKDEPPESPLRDYVFLGFMSARRPRKLTVSLPDTIRKLIFPQGQASLGLRPATFLTLAMVGSLAVFFINWRVSKAGATPTPSVQPVFYSQMSAEQQQKFVREKAQEISARLDNTGISEAVLNKVKEELDRYVQRIGNNSRQQLDEDLRSVLARGILDAPTVSATFVERKLPQVLGLYLVMVTSQYRGYYDIGREASNVATQVEVSRSVTDLEVVCASWSTFGSNAEGIALAIRCLDIPRDNLPDSQRNLISPNVPRFFAAAILGENPKNFRLQMDPLSSYTSIDVKSDVERISELISQLNGPERRNASNQLVQLYSQNKSAVVDALINAVLNDGLESYRINLYIGRTLALIRPNWEGTSDQLARLQALRQSQDYQDPTFKDWVERAISGFVEAALVVQMVEIEGGTFMMGRNDVDLNSMETYELNQYPAHQVSVRTFWMDKTEVTNQEYAEFVKATNHAPPDYWNNGSPPPDKMKWPVAEVSLNDANRFAGWRSQRDQIKYRLPTEEEWEYAARNGPQGTFYPWGNQWLKDHANLGATSPKPVDSFPRGASQRGVLGLIGNVWEWTSSNAVVYPGNNKMQNSPGGFVIRGGCFADPFTGPRAMTATRRWFMDRQQKDEAVGFRLVSDEP